MFEEQIKKIDVIDISLIKLSTACGILFLITIIPALMNLVHKIHWGWFLGALIVFAVRPMKKFYSK